MALISRKGRVPHRSSKLTSVLRDTLGGNCKTMLVANVYGEARHLEETNSTLKFAGRMQQVTNMAAVNAQKEISPAAALASCQSQIAELKRELAMHDQLANRSSVVYDPYSNSQKNELRGEVSKFLEGTLAELNVTSLRHVRETFEQFRILFQAQAQELEAAREAADNAAAGAGGLRVSAETEASPPVDIVQVGEVGEGDNAGFGLAPDDARPADRHALELGRSERGAAYEAEPVGATAAAGGGNAAADKGGGAARDGDGDMSSMYFSDFKRGQGAEVSYCNGCNGCNDCNDFERGQEGAEVSFAETGLPKVTSSLPHPDGARAPTCPAVDLPALTCPYLPCGRPTCPYLPLPALRSPYPAVATRPRKRRREARSPLAPHPAPAPPLPWAHQVSKMLLENKVSLRELRSKQRQLSHDVNATKRQIDELKLAVDRKRELRLRGDHVDELKEADVVRRAQSLQPLQSLHPLRPL